MKHFVRTNSHRVRQAASMVRDAMSYFHDLPYIGDAARVVGGVADRGVDLANRDVNHLEYWQRYAGYPVQNDQQVNPLQNDQQVNPLLGQQPVLVR